MRLCNKILFFLICLLLPCIAESADIYHVTALVSSNEQIFVKPLATFKVGLGKEVQTYTLKDDIAKDSKLLDRIVAEHPSLIFALGAKATYLAKIWTRKHQDIPVLFAMVLNWEQYRFFDGQSNMVGISSEVEPGNQFLTLSMFAPKVKRIGVIFSPRHSAHMVAKARKAAAITGLTLVEKQITRSKDFRRAYRQLAKQVDGVWLLNDPESYTLENMSWLSERCIKDKLACVGQGINLTEIGIMLSVCIDSGGIGTQAASMVKNILERKQSPASVGVMPPLGTHIALNIHTATSIGVIVSKQAIALANEIVE